ncbi:hypothetical protein GCM10009000_060410 [Halobacterium noricense]|uniref:Uncharacterized protein n=1 Tax=Haladaptatus pallidirubidus TaxID=1008152 RepID=A0AAV3UIB9_9EURY
MVSFVVSVTTGVTTQRENINGETCFEPTALVEEDWYVETLETASSVGGDREKWNRITSTLHLAKKH